MKMAERIVMDLLWITLILITPWAIFERFFLAACERETEMRG